MSHMLRTICFFSTLIILTPLGGVDAGQTPARVVVKDSLASPNQPVTVEARLTSQGPSAPVALGGEPLELVVYGKVVATANTGEDGTVQLPFIPKAQGVIPVQVRVGESPRLAPTEGQGHLAVWERRNPILVVEMASLMEEAQSKKPMAGAGLKSEGDPLPDAADELGKLTQFYYRVMYVVPSASFGGDRFQASESSREWLKRHQFPAGYVLTVPVGEQAFGALIDEFHAGGWTTIKTGIGRTKAFAEAFLQRRLAAVMVPEPAKGEVPRKAKVAKEWKEIRKKL